MIQYLLYRVLSTIPTLIGISFVTFVILNLAMTSSSEPLADAPSPGTLPGASINTRTHILNPHLPLFLNFSIQDARVRAKKEIEKLEDDRLAPIAKRTIMEAGGAWLPYLITELPSVSQKQSAHLLEALEGIAPRLNLATALNMAPDKKAFWLKYWTAYHSDFKPIRAARLARRLARRQDDLALGELRRLDTFSLPQLMDVLADDIPIEAKARIIEIIQEITQIKDPLYMESEPSEHEAVLKRWSEWWKQRYEMYTVFEGFDALLGTVLETRYFKWVVRLFTLDFGISMRDGRPISEKLRHCFPVTLILSSLALLLAYAFAVPLGIVSAVYRGRLFDRVATVFLFVLYSFPAFWMALLILRYFTDAGGLALFPSQGLHCIGYEEWSWGERMRDAGEHLVLPVICLSIIPMAMLARYQRVGMIQVINLDFMRTARAKGLSPTKVIVKHGLRNGMIPMVTMLGLQIPYVVSGSVVVERIFGIPGMGYETFEAIRSQDQPWLLAAVAVTAILTMLGVVVADGIYAFIDPRIVPGKSRGGAS